MPQASAPKRIAARLVTDSRVRPAQQPVGWHRGALGPHLRERAGHVEAVQRRDLKAGGVHRGPDLAIGGLDTGDDQLGHGCAEHGPRLAADDQGAVRGRGAGQACGQRYRAGAGTVGQADEQLARHPGRHQDRAGQHRRQERSGDQGPAQLFEGHGEFRQAVSLAAVLIGHVQAQHSLLAQAGREGLLIVRGAAVRPIGGGSHDLRRAVALRPSANRFRELQMFFGQAERHRPPRSPGSFSKMATF